MELRNCIKCGKLFGYDGNSDICNVCKEETKTDFEKVRDYLREYRKANIEQIHKGTKVEREKIIKFIKDGRLITEQETLFGTCRRCGAPIEHGGFCLSCQKELMEGLKPKKKKEEEKRKKSKEQMYIKDRIKRNK
ncbi:MAG: flagellar protein [bacterium]